MPNKLSYEYIKSYVEEQGCKLISDFYINNSEKLKFACKYCGEEYETTFIIFKVNKKHQCKECGLDIKRKKFAKTTEQFKKEVLEIDDNFEVIGEYYNSKTKIEMLFKPENKIIFLTPDDFLTGNRGYCYGLSMGENRIEKFLINNNIEYEKQYKFEDLVFINSLRFDFAIFKNKKLKLLIEYDGEPHYIPIKYSSKFTKKETLKRFEEYKFRDNLKNEYCKNKNILLIRIPYWHLENVEKILKDIVSSI